MDNGIPYGWKNSSNILQLSPLMYNNSSNIKLSRETDEEKKIYSENEKAPFYFTIGNVRLLVHGGIYLDLFTIPQFYRLSGIKQLGTLNGHYMFAGAEHTRHQHSIDTAIRVESAVSRLYPNNIELINLAIASGMLHDIFTPPFSEHGKFGNRKGLDEEYNINRVFNYPEILEVLEKYSIDPNELISVIRGEHPKLGKLLNSDQLDIDKISYTNMDGRFVVPHYTEPEKFEVYASNPMQFIQESVALTEDGDIAFTDAYAVRDILIRRAELFTGVYSSELNRAREAFLEPELERLWENHDLTVDKILEMNDIELKNFLRDRIDPIIFYELFEIFSDKFEEYNRIENDDLALCRIYGSQILSRMRVIRWFIRILSFY